MMNEERTERTERERRIHNDGHSERRYMRDILYMCIIVVSL